MRFTVGMAGVVSLGVLVAVAAAQGPGNATASRRGATLLPPQALPQSELPIIARAAAEELPYPAMTPVSRPATNGAPASGPGWLNGTDAGVRQAAGTTGAKNLVRPPSPKDEPSFVSRSFDKVKDAFGGSDKKGQPERSPGALPPGVANVQANSSTPFRGTSAAGTPVYAGPPAYRWYGWGSVTPGANPYAPTGQFPPASANWFTITGATPGAFPVPVTNPQSPVPGTEPPTYVTVANQRVAYPTTSPVVTARSSPSVREPSAHQPPPADLTRIEQPAAPTPTIAAPPPIVVQTPTAAFEPTPRNSDHEPTVRPAVAVPMIPPLPEFKPIEPASSATTPSPLPVSVTEDKMNWQPTNTQAPGEWGPAGGKSASPPALPGSSWQQPGANMKTQRQPIARGQVGEASPDATAKLRKYSNVWPDRLPTLSSGQR